MGYGKAFIVKNGVPKEEYINIQGAFPPPPFPASVPAVAGFDGLEFRK
jgi:hypothetical protein